MEQKKPRGRPFTSDQDREQARINGRKGGMAKKNTFTFKNVLIDRLNETGKDGRSKYEDLADVLIEMARSNPRAWEILRDTIGEKPTDTLAVDANVDVMTDADRRLLQRVDKRLSDDRD